MNNLLEEIGLTPGESKVYLALAKLGKTTTGPIAKESGVSASKVYKILDKLEIKGLIGKITQGKTTYYNATNPKQIIRYIEEKENELKTKKQEAEKLVSQLIAQQKTEKTNATILQGFKAITNAFLNIIDELKSNESYKVLGGTYNEIPGLREFFYKYHNLRTKKKIKLQMLINNDTKLEPTTKKLAKIKQLPKELDQLMEIVIYKQKVLIILWTLTPIGFLIENKEANQAFNKYFDTFWKLIK